MDLKLQTAPGIDAVVTDTLWIDKKINAAYAAGMAAAPRRLFWVGMWMGALTIALTWMIWHLAGL